LTMLVLSEYSLENGGVLVEHASTSKSTPVANRDGCTLLQRRRDFHWRRSTEESEGNSSKERGFGEHDEYDCGQRRRQMKALDETGEEQWCNYLTSYSSFNKRLLRE
jgi:hypothetical protein